MGASNTFGLVGRRKAAATAVVRAIVKSYRLAYAGCVECVVLGVSNKKF